MPRAALRACLPPPEAAMADHLAEDFRGAMRRLVHGVCVVTTGEGAGRTGLTATSVTSLSLEPPALLVCVNKASSVLPGLRAYGAFGVNLLGPGHRALAERFAGAAKGAERYRGAEWTTLATGAALLADAVAAIDCTVEAITEWHSHAVIVGRVAGVLSSGAHGALIYVNGRYMDI